MMARKNARAGAFVESAADYHIGDGEDFRVTINAKDFPARGPHGVFRVYRVFGDITQPERLHSAIGNLLAERGIERRRIEVSI